MTIFFFVFFGQGGRYHEICNPALRCANHVTDLGNDPGSFCSKRWTLLPDSKHERAHDQRHAPHDHGMEGSRCPAVHRNQRTSGSVELMSFSSPPPPRVPSQEPRRSFFSKRLFVFHPPVGGQKTNCDLEFLIRTSCIVHHTSCIPFPATSPPPPSPPRAPRSPG